MRTIKLICFLIVAAMTAAPASAWSLKKKNKKDKKYGVYLAGIAASFTDSVVYITDVQYMDSAKFNEKGLLEGRVDYSMQLKDYLSQWKNLEDRTCLMFFSKKKKKINKSLAKLRKKYTQGNALYLKDLPDFKFKLPEIEEF